MESSDEIKQLRLDLVTRLKEIAKEKGLTQEQLADKTGLLQSNVNRILSGKYSPSADLLLLIGKAMDVKLQWQDE